MQDQAKLQRFKAMVHSPLPAGAEASPEALVDLLQRGEGVPTFLNGRTLRDYQVTSFNWMVQHVLKGQNCMLGDEMGLGKTAQVWHSPGAHHMHAWPCAVSGHWARSHRTIPNS